MNFLKSCMILLPLILFLDGCTTAALRYQGKETQAKVFEDSKKATEYRKRKYWNEIVDWRKYSTREYPNITKDQFIEAFYLAMDYSFGGRNEIFTSPFLFKDGKLRSWNSYNPEGRPERRYGDDECVHPDAGIQNKVFKLNELTPGGKYKHIYLFVENNGPNITAHIRVLGSFFEFGGNRWIKEESTLSYEMIFSRIEYFLEIKKEWFSCEKAETMLNSSSYIEHINIEPLCFNGNDERLPVNN